MTFDERIVRVWAGLPSIAALICAGCLTPPVPVVPCAEPGAAPAPGAVAAAPAASPVAAANAAPPPGGKLLIWDGDTKGKSAQGWCEKKATCKVVSVAGAGHSGAGLKYHAEGADWMGMGWNWYGWWPKNAGSDISAYKNLSFWIRVQNKSEKEGLVAGSAQVILGCSKTDKLSAAIGIQDRVPDFADGQWHEVVLPVADFLKGDGAQFDPKTTWEFRVSTWAGEPRSFDIYIDDIGFDNR